MRKWNAIFEEFIKNYMNKVESILKIQLYVLDFGTCVAFTVSLVILYCNNTQNKASNHRERVVNGISYNKCTQ
jgi:hypothetical protein